MRYTIVTLIAVAAATVPSLAAPVDMCVRHFLLFPPTYRLFTASAVPWKMPSSPNATMSMQRSTHVSEVRPRLLPLAQAGVLSRALMFRLCAPRLLPMIGAPTTRWRGSLPVSAARRLLLPLAQAGVLSRALMYRLCALLPPLGIAVGGRN